jgi:GDP/UDP-N,N'-diacetylbacillosamine 2-epimerase (hydrolysing)
VAVVMGIPTAHISGGEITEGAIDDIVRHSITKMSMLHFPGCEEYRRRIIQMGEEPNRVFNYGDIGIENIRKMEFMTKSQLENDLNLSLDKPYAVVTFHPVTTEKGTAGMHIDNLLEVLGSIQDMQFIITKANADAGGQIINDHIDEFVANSDNSVAFFSVGIKRYLSLLYNCEMVIGNSSSGIIEAPCFGIPTVNIGNRQKGRLRAESVIDCEPTIEGIRKAIEIARTEEFKNIAREAVNPYGNGNTSEMIVKEIKNYLKKNCGIKKHFYDLRGDFYEDNCYHSS